MSETKMRIGGQEVTVQEMNYRALKQIFPLIKKMKEDQDQADEEAMMEDIISFLVIVLQRSSQPMTREELEEALLVSELPALQSSVMEVVANNGLIPAPGEVLPVEGAASPSTGTSTQSSAKSSPGSGARTGTE